MIQGLVIMNPRPKSGSKRKLKSMKSIRRRRRSGVARKIRRNPPTSAATRRKISLAVKRAMRKRRSGSSGAARTRTRVITRTRTRTRTRRVPVLRTRTRTLVRRVASRRRSASGRSMALGRIISKENLMLAGGVIGSNLVSRIVIGRFGNMLPGAAHPLGQAAYTLGISVGGAFLVKRFSKNLAEGLIIGGLVSVVNSVISMAMPAAAVGEYLGAGYDSTLSLGPATQQLAREVAPSPSMDAYLDSQPAFDNSAW